ncbi:hypothetical protein EJB05_14526, partial [Eragrostis curvula]
MSKTDAPREGFHFFSTSIQTRPKSQAKQIAGVASAPDLGAMDLVTGPIGKLVPKLLQLLKDEYKLQKDVWKQVKYLADELMSMHAALGKVAQVPYYELDEQVKLWASEVREASYDMEDVIDTFLVRVDGGRQPADDTAKVKRLLEKMGKIFSLSKFKVRRGIAGAIEEIKEQVDEMAKRRERYRVDDHVAKSSTMASIDPRVLTLHMTSEIVGIDESRDELIKMLTLEDDNASNKKMKIVSIVGSGGLGKTTLAKVVYEKLTQNMNIQCKAFVSVGQKPDLKKVLRDILLALHKEYYMNKTNFMILDEGQLIEEIQDFLKKKRYFIVIDDIWEVSSWDAIRIALQDKNFGCKIIITTRRTDVAELIHCSYQMKPLSPDSSKELFYGRIFGSKDECPERLFELSNKILNKCGGVPLSIITIASLLASKSDDISEWLEVCNSIGSGLSSRHDMYNNMRKILLLSYYDLPPYMKTCFVYLSMYPEDHEIERDRLIWRWICEGFVQTQKTGDDLFELGKSYFNDLINRSLVQPVHDSFRGVYACRVHDMILDMICSLSKEENFVTTPAEIEQVMSSKSKKLRRLSLKNTTWPKNDVSQVRSIAIFRPSIDSLPSFSCFGVLRVLDLQGCSLKKCQDSILDVGNLIHLRYLGLSFIGLKQVPRGIEKLQFLEVLKMVDSSHKIILPLSVFELKRLMCLEGVCCHPRQGNLLRKLASLQVLHDLHVHNESAGAVEELGQLTRLTKLRIQINSQMDQSISEAFINSLGNLQRLQSLSIEHISLRNNLIKWERWVPPSHLRILHINHDFSLRTMPKWISPASFPHLMHLHLKEVNIVRPEDIQMIGTLPNLSFLSLMGNFDNFKERPLQKFTVSADAFPRVTQCNFSNVVTVPSMFAQGAMLRAERIVFCIRAVDFSSDGGLSFDDLAMDDLPSLQRVLIYLHWGTGVSEEEVTKLKEALKDAADVHPTHPRMNVIDRKMSAAARQLCGDREAAHACVQLAQGPDEEKSDPYTCGMTDNASSCRSTRVTATGTRSAAHAVAPPADAARQGARTAWARRPRVAVTMRPRP